MAADAFVVGFLMFRFSGWIWRRFGVRYAGGLSDIALIGTDLGAVETLSTALQLPCGHSCDYGTPDLLSGVRLAPTGRNEMDPTRAPGYKAPEIRERGKNALITLILAEAQG